MPCIETLRISFDADCESKSRRFNQGLERADPDASCSSFLTKNKHHSLVFCTKKDQNTRERENPPEYQGDQSFHGETLHLLHYFICMAPCVAGSPRPTCQNVYSRSLWNTAGIKVSLSTERCKAYHDCKCWAKSTLAPSPLGGLWCHVHISTNLN